jgi:hypothetical protein
MKKYTSPYYDTVMSIFYGPRFSLLGAGGCALPAHHHKKEARALPWPLQPLFAPLYLPKLIGPDANDSFASPGVAGALKSLDSMLGSRDCSGPCFSKAWGC